MKSRIALLFATGFGLGHSPLASGTTGSLPGILVAGAMVRLPWYGQAVAVLVLAIAAVPLCGIAERHFGRKDDGRIVADEYLTFPLCLIGIPWAEHPAFLGVAFVVCRLADIAKPPPARQLQKLHGGAGIVMDDFVSSLYALGVNWALFWLMKRYLWG